MRIFAVGAFLVALAVLSGALGAHALPGPETREGRLWATAVDYHFVGAFGLVVLGLLRRGAPPRGPLVLFVCGLLLFSGSLYALSLGAPRVLGRITPFGGISLVAAWAWLGVHALRSHDDAGRGPGNLSGT